ncbi:MAG: hypothetical protein HDS65_06225 [Bacteroidales bacterium]|nr:hypothetical protein [Bacteroidales bacterium]
MANNKIKEDLLKLFDTLLLSYPDIEIKYEFSDDFKCYIASVDVSRLDEPTLESFSAMYLHESRQLQEIYGDDSPLFCMNEEWFKLSPEAISVSFYNDKITHVWTDMSENIFNVKIAASTQIPQVIEDKIPLAA